jgi:hypothetical protein
MGRHLLQNGREIYLERFSIAGTYAGVLEGSPETVSPIILQRLPGHAAQILSPANPLVIVPPSRMPLPGWLCVAQFGSQRGARQTDPDYNSRLYACWFADDMTRSIDVMVKAVLPYLDWERLAEDFDSMDF